MTSKALKLFAYGVVAFASIKILANFYFARDNTKTPFYISSFIVFLNVSISLSFFSSIGFLIIPLATSISTWAGVIIYLYLLKRSNFLLLQKKLVYSVLKIIFCTIIMSITLQTLLNYYTNYLDYNYMYKLIYLLIIICFVGIIYLLFCYLLGLLKIRNYKAN